MRIVPLGTLLSRRSSYSLRPSFGASATTDGTASVGGSAAVPTSPIRVRTGWVSGSQEDVYVALSTSLAIVILLVHRFPVLDAGPSAKELRLIGV